VRTSPQRLSGIRPLLVQAGIDSMSVSPDSFIRVKEHIAAAERQKLHAVGA
jgi:phosphoenolpyruvate-protein kinase (PTS system EI component)